MSAPNANTKTEPASPAAKPIDILPGQLSLIFASLHPILILSVLFLSFDRLVHDPVTTLIALAPKSLILQALYCIICLPYTGQTTPTQPKPGQKKKPSRPGQDIWARVVPATLSLLLTLSLTTPLLTTLAVLFGAPVTTHHAHTALLALHISLLTTPHLFYAHGLDASTWFKLASLQVPVDELYGMGLGALVGAWVGAVPIPLDWDREWQKWPVTVLVGGYVGAVVGKVLGGYVAKGRRMKLS